MNLNYTASNETLESCAKQCELMTVVTSKALLEKLKVKVPTETILLEEAAANPRFREKIIALLLWFLPARWIERILRRQTPGDIGRPGDNYFFKRKHGRSQGRDADALQHRVEHRTVGQTFMLERQDCLLGVLPFFHSFGFTVTLWLPAVLGVGVVYHPNPLDLGAVGELVREYRVTFLLSTPTFLQAYLRRCSPEDFGSVQFVMAGAEKLPERLSLAFEDRFGIRPLEGYGATECSPVVAVNTRDFRAPGFRQVGAKRGKIGHPLPGMSVRIVDPETMAPLPLDTAGFAAGARAECDEGIFGASG